MAARPAALRPDAMARAAALLALLAAAAAEEGGSPVIPAPSTSCGGAGVVVGWCMQDAPLCAVQPPPGNYTDAECCAACVKSKGCVAWNTNTGQGACHFRAGIGTPNRSPICNFGVVRPPPPPPPPPPPIKPAPPGAKNLLVIVCDDFRPFIAPWTDRYGIKAPNLEKLASES